MTDEDDVDAELVERAARDAHTVEGVAVRLRVTRDRARSLLAQYAGEDGGAAADVLEASPFERASERGGSA